MRCFILSYLVVYARYINYFKFDLPLGYDRHHLIIIIIIILLKQDYKIQLTN